MKQSDLPENRSEPIDRRQLAIEARVALAIVHGVGATMSIKEMLRYILEHGLPGPAERERIREQKLKENDDG